MEGAYSGFVFIPSDFEASLQLQLVVGMHGRLQAMSTSLGCRRSNNTLLNDAPSSYYTACRLIYYVPENIPSYVFPPCALCLLAVVSHSTEYHFVHSKVVRSTFFVVYVLSTVG